MGFTGVTINRLNGGLGRKNPTADGNCLLVIGGAVAATGLAIGAVAELLSVDDAETLGITAAYDDTNDILAHHHIDEFFRISPDGNLFILLDDGTLTNATLRTILNAQASIKAIGIVRNAATAPANFATYIAGYQTLIDELRAANRYVSSVLVEGVQFDDATLISAYTDLRTYNAPNVSVVIAQDPVIRAVKAEHETYAAIGTALGAISVRAVSENLGSVNIRNKPAPYKATNDYPLTDVARSRWVGAVLQSGIDFGALTAAQIATLNERGYILVGFYNGYPGYFFNDSHTCVEIASDYARIENNRVWDKAALLLRNALLPKLRGNLPVDPNSGELRSIAAKELEAIGKQALEGMEAAEEISGSDVYIDPSQTVATDAPLTVRAQLVFNRIVHEITIDLGLTNKIS